MNQGINAYDLNPTANQDKTNTEINANLFSNIDFGPLKAYLDDDNITDISYSNNGQVWLKSLDKGVYRVENPGINNDLMEKIDDKFDTINTQNTITSEYKKIYNIKTDAENMISERFKNNEFIFKLITEQDEQNKLLGDINNFIPSFMRQLWNNPKSIATILLKSDKNDIKKYLANFVFVKTTLCFNK